MTVFTRRQRQHEDRLRRKCMKWKIVVTPSGRQQSIKNESKVPFRYAHRGHRLSAPKAFHELRQEGVTARIKARNQANNMADRGAIAAKVLTDAPREEAMCVKKLEIVAGDA